jgi:hypothetical protein
MIARRASILVTPVLLACIASGCAASPSVSPTSSPMADDPGVSVPEPATPDNDPRELTGDGMPELPLEPCEEIVDSETLITAGNSQWTFELLCLTRQAFDDTSANLLAAGFELGFAEVLGSESNVSDWNYFITTIDVMSLEVDVKITGSDEEFEVTSIVTETRSD